MHVLDFSVFWLKILSCRRKKFMVKLIYITVQWLKTKKHLKYIHIILIFWFWFLNSTLLKCLSLSQNLLFSIFNYLIWNIFLLIYEWYEVSINYSYMLYSIKILKIDDEINWRRELLINLNILIKLFDF